MIDYELCKKIAFTNFPMDFLCQQRMELYTDYDTSIKIICYEKILSILFEKIGHQPAWKNNIRLSNFSLCVNGNYIDSTGIQLENIVESKYAPYEANTLFYDVLERVASIIGKSGSLPGFYPVDYPDIDDCDAVDAYFDNPKRDIVAAIFYDASSSFVDTLSDEYISDIVENLMSDPFEEHEHSNIYWIESNNIGKVLEAKKDGVIPAEDALYDEFISYYNVFTEPFIYSFDSSTNVFHKNGKFVLISNIGDYYKGYYSNESSSQLFQMSPNWYPASLLMIDCMDKLNKKYSLY